MMGKFGWSSFWNERMAGVRWIWISKRRGQGVNAQAS